MDLFEIAFHLIEVILEFYKKITVICLEDEQHYGSFPAVNAAFAAGICPKQQQQATDNENTCIDKALAIAEAPSTSQSAPRTISPRPASSRIIVIADSLLVDFYKFRSCETYDIVQPWPRLKPARQSEASSF